jgi:hypothetical protein
VVRELSVPPTERMPLDIPALTDVAVCCVPSTRNASEFPDDGDGVGVDGGGVGFVVPPDVAGAGDGLGEVGLLPPPQAPARTANDSRHQHESLMA